MRTTSALPLLTVVAIALSACSDEPRSTAPIASTDENLELSATQWRGVGPQSPPAVLLFGRFVSVGTSVTMGWQSDGVVGSGQRESWAVQLSARAARLMSVPYIGGFGCRAPLAAPLSTGKRTSGESAAANTSTLSCADNKPFVRLPEQNVALAGATTLNALTTTPETQSDPSFLQMYDRVLPSGKTQVQAALSQNPLLVSVELGANEVLGARSGVAIPGVTMFPVSSWQPLYDNVVNTLADKVPYGIAFTLINDAATFPAFRRGSELWADRGALAAAFHVAVQPDCESSMNLLFVPVRIPTAVAQGAAAKAAGQPMVPLSCAGAPPTVQDYVLTPDELAIVNGQLAQMNAHIETRARARGWAVATLDALYGRANLKAPFSSVTLMTSQKPYGPFISLDGVHPSAAGHDLLADNVERALEVRYGIRLPLSRLMARLGERDRDGHGPH